ncbi:MAG: hypothetical protein HYV09_30115 [Deltaproteobacteria bacterium]|nr:hypothetical protein [Deltaproteobacteria bacterium]
MTRWLGALLLCASGCVDGELGDVATEDDAAVAPADSTAVSDAPIESTDATSPDASSDGTSPPADTSAPFDGAPADFGTGECAFGGGSLAAAIVTATVADAAPIGGAILAERPGGLVVAWRSAAGFRVTPLDATGARAGVDVPIDASDVYGVAAGSEGSRSS